jgi:antitoxin MazE
MLTKVRRWGNSLAVRIPHSFAAEAEVGAGTTVGISVVRGNLVIRPMRRRKYQYHLSELLAKVNKSNVHRELSTGRRVGREAW